MAVVEAGPAEPGDPERPGSHRKAGGGEPKHCPVAEPVPEQPADRRTDDDQSRG